MLLDSLELYLEFGRTETLSYHQVTTCLRRLASYFMAKAQDPPPLADIFRGANFKTVVQFFVYHPVFQKRNKKERPAIPFA